jgi:arginase
VGGVTNNTVSLVSIPLAIGQPYVGPDTSPNLLKKNGLLQLLGDCGWRVDQMPDVLEVTSNDVGSIDMSNLNAKNCASIGATCEVAAKVIYEKAMDDNFILILGGDHSIPIGTIPGLMKARPNTGVVWVDAHADINVPKSSPSGNMHGMPVSFLMGLVEEAKKYPSMSWFEACLKPQDLCYIGLRDLDTPEKELIRSLGIKAYSMYDVDRLGIGMVMEQTKDYFADKSHLHMSYDIDALDPFFAPSTGTAVRGGLTFREGNFICESLCETGKLASLELVEVNPSLHSNVDAQSTVDMALTLLGSSMGQRIL